MPQSETSSTAADPPSSVENLLDQASAAIDAAVGDRSSASEPIHTTVPYQLDNLTDASSASPASSLPTGIDLLGEVELDLRIELGRTEMSLQEVLQLRGGSVVALDSFVGDPVNVYVNGRIIAKGEVLVMDDNFCVRVTELVGA